MNPTNKTYSFSWTNEDATDPSRQLTYDEFTCLTPKGSIEAGKKVEIIFEYTPDSMDLRESFWRFYIQEQNVSVSFLLVGITTDPAISLDKSHVNFKELLIGTLHDIYRWFLREVRQVYVLAGVSLKQASFSFSLCCICNERIWNYYAMFIVQEP